MFVEGHKPQALWVEEQLNFSNWSISMLSDNQVGNILYVRVVWLVVSRAVDERHDIGILLDTSGLA